MNKPHKQTLMVAVLAASISGMALAATDSSEPGKVYPAFQAGVRHAADQGPEALRHYIERTRMIYGFYYWDFAK